jgi:hypothetical protein
MILSPSWKIRHMLPRKTGFLHLSCWGCSHAKTDCDCTLKECDLVTLVSRSTVLHSSAHGWMVVSRVSRSDCCFRGVPLHPTVLVACGWWFDVNSSPSTVSEISLPFTVTFRNTEVLRSKSEPLGY